MGLGREWHFVRTLLSIRSDLEIVGTACSGEEALEQLRLVVPDVILMDIRMPGMGGVEATQIIKELHPNVVILILTTFDDYAYIIEALCNGAAVIYTKIGTNDRAKAILLLQSYLSM
jgi:DNA-binding NarL/FixJ family response regulator